MSDVPQALAESIVAADLQASNRTARWKITTLGAIHRNEATGTIPNNTPKKTFELYSVPAHETGSPEIVRGEEIGSNKQTVVPNTVLLCKINPRINRVWVVREKSDLEQIASTEWIPFFPVGDVAPHFLAWFLRQAAVRDFLASNASGVGGSLMRVKASTLRNYALPLPPIPEQLRIVAEIEKQFTRLDAGVASLKRVQVALKRYRASVLKAACEGQWAETTLGECFKVERGRFSVRPRNDPQFYGGQYPFVQIGNLPRDGGRIRSFSQSLNEAGLGISKMFRSGSVLIAIVGATIGNTGILSFDSCAPDSIVALQSDNEVLCRFAEIYLRSKKLAIRSASYSSGGQPNINLAFLRAYPFPLPPDAEQQCIVEKAEQRLSVIEQMEVAVAANLKRAERLRQSILHRAFLGGL
jgi:type I restriction enzyme S subunit